jgi:ABC-type amino acid transport substrate-binding protein
MQLRRCRRSGLAFAAALLVFAGGPASAGSLAEIKRAKRLVVAAATADLPLEGDILKGLARAQGVELRIEPQPTATAALQAVHEGRADVAAGGLVSQRDRRDGVAFSAELFPTRFVAVNRAPTAALNFIEELRNASRILAPAATGAAEVAQAAKLPGLKTETTLTGDKVLAALRADANSVALVGLFDALVARRADPALQIGAAMGPRHSVAFAVRQGDADLLAVLNAHVGQLRGSASYRLVLARGLGEDSLRVLSRAHLEERP